jgi:chromosome segregation ATPase
LTPSYLVIVFKSHKIEDLDVAKDLIEEMDEELKEKTGMIESLKQKLEEANEHGAREQKMESERVQQRLDEKQFAIAIMEESVEKMSLDLERAQQQVKSEQRRGLKRANDLQAKLYEKDGVIGTMINMIESLQKEVISLEKEKKREDFGGKPNYSLGTASKASSRGFFKNLAGAALGSFSESIQYELDQATATIEKNKEQVDMLVEQLEEKTSQIASLKKQLEEAEKARKRSKSPKRGLATKQEKVPNADNDNVELIRSLETRAENAQSELKRMQKDFDDLAEELAEKESEMRDLQAKLEIATKALEDGYRDKNDSESEAEMKKLQLLLAEKEAVIRTLNDTLETANQSLQKNKESINRYIKIESDLTEKLAQLESRLSENENRHIEKEFDLARKLELAQRSVSEKEATIKSLQEMIEKESKSTYSDEKKEVSIRTLEVKVASIQTDFDGLADELSEKKEENRSLGTELEVVKKARTDIESDKMQLEETQSKLKKTKTLLAEKELTAKLMRNKLNDYKEDVEKHAITLSELEKVKALLTQKESMMESLTENVNEANRILGEHEAALCMHRAAELEFSEKLEELQESLVRKDDAIYSLETTQEDKSALEENKYDLCKSLQEQVDESHRKLRIIREDYNKLGNESQRLATKFKAMSSEALETFKQFADIQSKLEKGKAALEIEESMEGASTELAKKQGDVGALERKLQSLINTNKDLVEKDAWVETDLSVKLNKIQTLESSLVNAQASLEMRQEDIELELKEKCTEYENTIESLKQQLQDAKYLSNDTHDNFDMQVNQFDQNDSHIESLQKEVEQTSAALRAQEVQMIDQKMAATKSEETANSEILALRIEIESLGNELSEKDSQIQAIRNQSKEKRQNKIWKTERVSDQSPKSDSTETDIPPSIEQAFIDAENSFEMEEAALDALASELAEKDYTRLVESLESELCASKAQLKDMITLSDALSTDLRLKDDQLEVVKKQGIGLHQNLAAKEDQLQLMHAKTESIVSGLNDQLDEFRCEVDLIKTEKKELEKKIETTKQERVVSVAESKLIEEEHEKLKDKSALLEKEKLSLETSLAMLTTGAIAKESKERELHSSLSEAKNTINALTQRLGEQVSLMIAEKQKHLSEKEAVYEEMTKSSSALESAEFEVIKLNRKFELAKEEKSLMESQCHRVEKDKLLLSEKVKELQTALKKEKAVMIDLQDQATQAKASAIATEEELQNQIEHLSERFKMIEGLGEEVERATVQFQKTNEKKDSRIIQLETQYTKTLDSLKDREKDIERQDERLIQLLSEKEMYVSDHQEATTKLEAQLVDAQHQSALFKLEKKNAIGVIEEIRAEKMELAEHCKALELNIESLTEQIAKLKFETETLVVGTDDLTQSLGDARKEVESLELEIKIVTRESDEKVQELQSLHHEINEFILRISEKNKEIEELEQQHLDEKVLLNDQVRQKNSKIQALGFELKSEKEDLEMKNEEIKLLISKLDALENTSLSESLDQRYIIETLKRRLDYASEQRNELEEKNKSEILAKQLEQKDTLVAKLKSDNAKMTLNDEIIKSLEVKLRDVTGNFKQAGKKQAELESSLQEKEGTIQALQKNRRNTSRIIYELKETNKKQAEDAASATLRQRVTNRHQIRRTTDGTTTNKNLAFDGYMESFTIDVNKARAQYEKARKTLKMAIARERLVRPL